MENDNRKILCSNFLFKIEEEDLIVIEKETHKNEHFTVYESEYLDFKTDFVIFNREENLEKEISDRLKFSCIFAPSIIGLCDHSTLGLGLILKKPKGESVFTLVYNKDLNFNNKIDLIYSLISFYDYSNSRGVYFTSNGSLNDFVYDLVSDKIKIKRFPLFSQNVNQDESASWLDNIKTDGLVNMSPEIIEGEISNEKSDAWNLGLLIYEILEADHLIFSDFVSRDKIIEKLKKLGKGENFNTIIKKLNSLSYNQYVKNHLKKLLKFFPKQRSSAKLVKQTFNKKLILEYYLPTAEKEKFKKRESDKENHCMKSTDFYINESACPFNNEVSIMEISREMNLNFNLTINNNDHLEVEHLFHNNTYEPTDITEDIRNRTLPVTETKEELIEKIFENKSNKRHSRVNFIDLNNVNDVNEEKENETTEEDKDKIITPICGEINIEGENFIQFEEENEFKNEEKEKEDIEKELLIDSLTANSNNKFEREIINLNIQVSTNKDRFNSSFQSESNINVNNFTEKSIIITGKTDLNRLEELAHDYYLTGSDRCLEELEDIIINSTNSQNIKETICTHEETISENLYEALVNLAYKYLEVDDIKSHHTISSILYSSIENVFNINDNPFKFAIAKFHYAKSIKDYSCNYSLSLNLFLEAIKLLEKANEADSKIGIQIKFFLGNLYDDMGRSEESIEILKDVCDKQTKMYTEQHTFTARTLNCLGIAEDNRANYRQAKEYYNKSYTIFKYLSFGMETIDSVKVLNNLAGIYYKWEDYKSCTKFYLKVLEVYLNKYGVVCSYVAITYYNLGNCYLMLNNSLKALEVLKKSLDIFNKELGFSHPQTAMCIKTLGDVYYSVEDNKNALEMYNQCVNTFLEKFGDDNDTYISTLSQIKKIKMNQIK